MEPITSPVLLHDLVCLSARRAPADVALVHGKKSLSYDELQSEIQRGAASFCHFGLKRFDRLAIYLPKSIENVVAIFAASLAGLIVVPVNPVLKPDQVAYLLEDCGASGLVTTPERLTGLAKSLPASLRWCMTTGNVQISDIPDCPVTLHDWIPELPEAVSSASKPTLESDPVAILYTSGSTGRPKGVVLTHRNVVLGAVSVASYLNNSSLDRILSVLPLSFDAGFSQLTTAFSSGARVVLLDYLVPKDVVRACAAHGITGITGVPPLWTQLAAQRWEPKATRSLRYFANTGGKMARSLLDKLRSIFPQADPFLMYGLTEAFRSTYLAPEQIDVRPDSIGKAIPNAEVLIVRSDGSLCEHNEVGELVHRGPLVAAGYWRDPERTRERFRPSPVQAPGLPDAEIAVWSGDTARVDADGYIYFVGRNDEMIKTSGYRVSPTEVEDIALAHEDVTEAAAFGVPDESLGQAIVLVLHDSGAGLTSDSLQAHFRRNAPAYMIPKQFEVRERLPKNANGKIDRAGLKRELQSLLGSNGNSTSLSG